MKKLLLITILFLTTACGFRQHECDLLRKIDAKKQYFEQQIPINHIQDDIKLIIEAN